MYVPFFGLKNLPFSIAPDPRYLYMSERHREALAHLLYGLGGGGGFVLLTGEIGAGKTTVCRCFLEQVPAGCHVAYVFNPKLTVVELLQSICDEFGVAVAASASASAPPTVKDYIDPLNRFLLAAHAAGRHTVLVIDEAQNLSADVLEQLRLLTNLETDERKLLQILLIGQPELRTLLARPELEQLAQRVIARYHLGPLSAPETAAYVTHRLAVAGLVGAAPFTPGALAQVQRSSRGVPRRINLLCDRALLGAYAQGQRVVDRRTVRRAAAEVFGADGNDAPGRPWRRVAALLAAGLTGAALAAAVWLGVGRGGAPEPAPRLSDSVAGPRSPAASTWPRATATPAASGATPLATQLAAASVANLDANPGANTAAGVAPGRANPNATAVAVVASTSAALNGPAALALLADAPRDEHLAWRALALAWGADLGEGDPCAAARAQRLLCYRSAGSTLATLRLLDRPGLLLLRGDNGAPRHAQLTGLATGHALLTLNGQRLALPLDELAKRWRGEFATLWRTPEGYTAALSSGARGSAVDALAAGLAQARGEPPPTPGLALSGALLGQLATFQLAQGLQPDGVAGPTTFMRLHRALGLAEPRLELPAAPTR